MDYDRYRDRIGIMTDARAKACITHHHACDCREYRFGRMELALKKIHAWAKNCEDVPNTVLHNIEDVALSALRDNETDD